ncbi:GRAM domain-containing protein 2A [Latimeria chalumnae]|uniref:GRAM domain-containing protein 2A n=1 Tax=Latimeria chalumnae TaxID=7897 RepID=UPI00313E6B78
MTALGKAEELHILRLKLLGGGRDCDEVCSPLCSQQRLDSYPMEEPIVSPACSLQLQDAFQHEEIQKFCRGQRVNKHNTQYHKLFKNIPGEEILMKAYSCALQKEFLLQGRLYISRNWLCFHANLFGKDVKVMIPVLSVRLVKKHKTAGLVPNGLAITTDTSKKYIFVSLLSRDSAYEAMARVCTHLQMNGKSLSVREFTEEPGSISLDELAPDMKWRRKISSTSLMTSLPDTEYQCILGNSTCSLNPTEGSFLSNRTQDVGYARESESPLHSSMYERNKKPEKASLPLGTLRELTRWEYQILTFFIILLVLLIVSSCYLAFRVSSLEQQLSFISSSFQLTNYESPR